MHLPTQHLAKNLPYLVWRQPVHTQKYSWYKRLCAPQGAILFHNFLRIVEKSLSAPPFSPVGDRGGFPTYPDLPDPPQIYPTPPFFTRPPPRLTRPPFLGGEGEKPLEKAVTGRFLPLLPHLPDLSLITELGKKEKGEGKGSGEGREGVQRGI